MGKGEGLKNWHVAVIVAIITAFITSLVVGGLAAVLSWYFTDHAVTDDSMWCSQTSNNENITMIYYHEKDSTDQRLLLQVGNGSLGAPLFKNIPNDPQERSCKSIKANWPYFKTGYYTLVKSNGEEHTQYCMMDPLCGLGGGGWTRIAIESSGDCSSTGFYHKRPDSPGGSCGEIRIPVRDVPYTEVCGFIEGFQSGSPDADDTDARNDINSYFVDGLIILRDNLQLNNPTDTHVWSLMADNGDRHCPCNKFKNRATPPFVGNNYYCEAGTTKWEHGKIYSDDPLWDGQGCDDSETPCCNQSPLMPWFYRGGLIEGTYDILFRDCGDQSTDDENVIFGRYELYIR